MLRRSFWAPRLPAVGLSVTAVLPSVGIYIATHMPTEDKSGAFTISLIFQGILEMAEVTFRTTRHFDIAVVHHSMD